MIIAINGYAGSGKDTLGIMVQYLLSKQGKPSIEEVLKNYEENQWWLEESSGWEIKKFAGKLKDVASHLTGIDVEDFEDQEFKKTNLGVEWWTTCDEGHQPMTVRDFLQKLGTDALRIGLHENVWVNALMADYQPLDFNPLTEAEIMPNWVITDIRYENEAKAVKDKGGIIIRVDRPGVNPINNHPSEVGLDNWNFDYKIANVSDIVALMFTLQNILKHHKILK